MTLHLSAWNAPLLVHPLPFLQSATRSSLLSIKYLPVDHFSESQPKYHLTHLSQF